MSMYVKKNGVVKRISGVPRGWNAVKTFNVPSSLWEANQDSVTSADYPYIAEITTDYFSNDDSPQWQMNGVGDIPVGNEIACCDMIRNAIFLSTGVVLYATDLVTEDLVLETGMFAKGYSYPEPIFISGTIEAGETSITLSNSAINTDSIINGYFWDVLSAPESITVAAGSVTITIEAQEEDLDVAIRVINI